MLTLDEIMNFGCVNTTYPVFNAERVFLDVDCLGVIW